jgi:tetratricopeptide (TPR) repeat protein
VRDVIIFGKETHMKKVKILSALLLLAFGISMSPAYLSAAFADLCEDADFYLEEGNRFIATQPESARKLYAEALRICDTNLDINYHLSLAYYLEGRSEEAIEILNAGLLADPDHLNSNKALAYIYMASGIDPGKGKEIIKKVLENNPGDKEARRINVLFLLDDKIQRKTLILEYLPPMASEKKTVGRFQVIKEQVVFDKERNLYWSRQEPVRGYYPSARKYCDNLSLGGFNDWRLPTKNEISTLVESEKKPQRGRPIFDEKVFPNHRAVRYWVYNQDMENRISYNMERGKVSQRASREFVWCVRD